MGKQIKTIVPVLIIMASVWNPLLAFARDAIYPNMDSSKLENPMTVEYLQAHLRSEQPRLILTPELRQDLQAKIQSDPMVKNYYAAIKLNAKMILEEPLLERIQVGRRLLSVSREMLYRMGILGMVYSMEGDAVILDRINDEVGAVCHFSDWNPSHYLDVAEMSLAVALAIDWVGESLPEETVELAKKAIIEKGIKPSYNAKGNVGWIKGNNNWNQVCHGGMIAASIVIAEEDPELAATTIHRALDGIPHAMDEYGPNGVYPEGSTYWAYGTSFTVLTSSMLQSAFGSDFGLAQYPAFLESADFRVLCNAPSGWYYNFADCGDRRGENGDIVLAWFATHTGNATYLERERFLRPAGDMGKLSRIAGPGLVWLSQFTETTQKPLPTAWMGKGANPIVIFTGSEGDPGSFYFGGKGGRGSVNHGNMDAGSFILELDGVRWVVDPGNQGYHALEKTGFHLWGRCQECERWTLLTKNNFGHSTLTVNEQLHVVDGMATIADFSGGPNPSATLDMAPVFKGQLESAKRSFTKVGDRSLSIVDELVLTDSTKSVYWQLMTTADVELIAGGVTLHQDGKKLQVRQVSHPGLTFSVISLDPPPLELDRKITGLKRLELRLPNYLFEGGKGKIEVLLSGE